MDTDCTGVMNVPVLLLKTKSTPSDAYEETLSSHGFSRKCIHGRLHPRFVPVLRHRFDDDGIQEIQSLLLNRRISRRLDAKYGGIIFTSQRAVEAFSHVVQHGKGTDSQWPHLQNVPIYSVGPATTRALRVIPQQPPLQIFGEATGNGEALANYILEHYKGWFSDRPTLTPLLFLVGEQRRDVIPRMLMDVGLTTDRRIRVNEVVVYGTGVMESFSADFEAVLKETSHAPERWVVVFSPTGCDSMLQGLGLLNPDADSGMICLSRRDGKTFVATIGPTTRAHLVSRFGFEPDVCAETPSPDGILQGIVGFSPDQYGRNNRMEEISGSGETDTRPGINLADGACRTGR
ncbi:hypothetical protein E4U42_002591 [Claviceps africana]|uniref:Tetrapyrrole biosynthesis uroporphyrinogen III synthase domain-containing protein n=1 Tax=Claviceps africana TaxID=83212 RepID=A0A8K0NJF3_9HYPO|nr:hypothetical protein E4U42_002591 [Claviceps africana]